MRHNNELTDNLSAWNDENFYFGQSMPTEKAWYEKLLDVYGTVRARKEADKLRKENLERMRRGQSPLSVDDWRALTPPAATVEVGMAPQTQRLLIFGALGLGAVLLLMRRKRG